MDDKFHDSEHRLISVEAVPTNAKLLRASMKLNNLSNIHLYEYAVSDGDLADSVDMVVPQRNHGMGHMSDRNPNEEQHDSEETVTVPATTLDAIAKYDDSMQNILAMKIDI